LFDPLQVKPVLVGQKNAQIMYFKKKNQNFFHWKTLHGFNGQRNLTHRLWALKTKKRTKIFSTGKPFWQPAKYY
jgi:phage antirepressor YoqD-like protein